MIRDLASTLTPGQPVYVMLYAGAIISSVFSIRRSNTTEGNGGQPEEVGCLCSHPAGEQTAKYLEKILLRSYLGRAIYGNPGMLLPESILR